MTDTFYGSDFGALEAFDPDIAGVLVSELDRLRGGLQLIASENFSSPEVLTALGSTLSNKYAEGYPGRRYYGGCSEVDKAETLAIERCKALFAADHANVQAHSGASANQAVYGAFLKPGEKILAIFPIIRTARWGAPWTSEVRTRSAQWQRVLDRDKRLSRTLAAPVTEGRPLPKGVRAVLYERK